MTKQTRAQYLIHHIYKLTEDASSHCRDSCDWYNTGPEDADKRPLSTNPSWWDAIDDAQSELLGIVQAMEHKFQDDLKENQ